LSKHYWSVAGHSRKFYSRDKVEQFTKDIELATGIRPLITYNRQLGLVWVRTTLDSPTSTTTKVDGPS
jgi:hypothetical protein